MSKVDWERKDEDIRALIVAYLSRKNMSKKSLIDIVGISRGRFYSCWHNPTLFRVGDLRLIYDVLMIPEGERVGL